MHPLTIIELSDVAGLPRVKMTLPVPMRQGDHVRLKFQLQRKNGGRNEVLSVSGDFRVTRALFDLSGDLPRQILSVESTGKAPAWRAVKGVQTPPRRPLGPTRFPRTPIV